jgi:hypothetical protein
MNIQILIPTQYTYCIPTNEIMLTRINIRLLSSEMS